MAWNEKMQAALYYARKRRLSRIDDSIKMIFAEPTNRYYIEVSPGVALLWG